MYRSVECRCDCIHGFVTDRLHLMIRLAVYFTCIVALAWKLLQFMMTVFISVQNDRGGGRRQMSHDIVVVDWPFIRDGGPQGLSFISMTENRGHGLERSGLDLDAIETVQTFSSFDCYN